MITITDSAITVVDGDSYHDMEEHGLSFNGFERSLAPLGVRTEIIGIDATADYASPFALVSDAAGEYWSGSRAVALTVKVTGRLDELIATVFVGSEKPSSAAIVSSIARDAGYGDLITFRGDQEFEDLGASARLNRDEFVQASNALRDQLIATIGRDETGWLMHGLDAEDFGYNIKSAD